MIAERFTRMKVRKMLTVAIREASTGQELDTVSVRVGTKGLSDDSRSKLSEELDGDRQLTVRVLHLEARALRQKAPRRDVPVHEDGDERGNAEGDADAARAPESHRAGGGIGAGRGRRVGGRRCDVGRAELGSPMERNAALRAAAVPQTVKPARQSGGRRWMRLPSHA